MQEVTIQKNIYYSQPLKRFDKVISKSEHLNISQKPVSFGSAVVTKSLISKIGNAFNGVIPKISKASTSLILKINKSNLPGPIKSWSTYMIANVPVLSNIVFKSPITEGDLIFATAAALPFARTVSETKDRRREAFLRDMSGFVIFLTCVRAVQGLEWERVLKFMEKAKPLQKLAKDNAISLMNMTTRMFPDTQKMLSELARIDKIDDVIKAAVNKGTLDDILKSVFSHVKEPNVANSAMSYFQRVPRAKEHFVKALEVSATNPNGLKTSFANLNKLKNFRSIAGAIIGGIAYILISGIGINKLNQYLAKRDKEKNNKDNNFTPKGIPFARKLTQDNILKSQQPASFILKNPVDLKSIKGGHLSNRDQFMDTFNKLMA